jgi:hypothetical protein
VLAQQYRDVAHKGNEADDAANDVLFAVEEGLALRVELGVVRKVVVALGEQAEGCLAMSLLASLSTIEKPVSGRRPQLPRVEPCRLALGSSALATSPTKLYLLSAVSPHHPVHDRNIFALNIVHHNLSDLCVQTPVPQEQQISPLESRLHGP